MMTLPQFLHLHGLHLDIRVDISFYRGEFVFTAAIHNLARDTYFDKQDYIQDIIKGSAPNLKGAVGKLCEKICSSERLWVKRVDGIIVRIDVPGLLSYDDVWESGVLNTVIMENGKLKVQ